MKTTYLIILATMTAGFIQGCQRFEKVDYEEGYVTPTGLQGDNSYWSNNYRLNSSNYLANRNFDHAGIYNTRF